MRRTNAKRATLPLAAVAAAVVSLGSAASASAATPPLIASESASGITQTDATLEAQINPNGANTAYEFQIARSSSYDYTQMACPLSLPNAAQCLAIVVGSESLPPGVAREPSQGSIPSGSGDQPVSLDLASIGANLQPGTTYHYRVIASNDGQIVSGSDQTFTTSLASVAEEPPSIESESVSNVTEHDATLGAQINPNGLETGYQFRLEYGCFSTGAACFAIAEKYLPTEEIPASSKDQSVSVDLNDAGVTLHPGWEYRYSVEATNSEGVAHGATRTFTTPSEPPGPIPLGAQSPGDVAQPSSAIPAPPVAALPPRRKHHRRHEHGLHRNRLH